MSEDKTTTRISKDDEKLKSNADGILRLTALALHGSLGAREALLRVLQRHLDRPLPLLLVELLLRNALRHAHKVRVRLFGPTAGHCRRPDLLAGGFGRLFGLRLRWRLLATAGCG